MAVNTACQGEVVVDSYKSWLIDHNRVSHVKEVAIQRPRQGA